MNLVPSDHPRLAGAASLSKPGFDIVAAVASARQAAQPTVRMLRAQATRDAHRAYVNALIGILGERAANAEQMAPRPVRFFDLSDDANGSTETMNSLYTRGFQPMFNSADIEPRVSVQPIPHDEDNIE